MSNRLGGGLISDGGNKKFDFKIIKLHNLEGEDLHAVHAGKQIQSELKNPFS